MTDSTNKLQEVDVFETAIISRLDAIEKSQRETRETMHVLSETLAAHVRQNIETFQKISEYIGDQMSYRLFRQGMEENNLQLELEKKKLELEFAQKRFDALEKEHQEDTEESQRLRLDYDKQKLELESLKKNIELLQGARISTKEKMTAVKMNGTSRYEKLKDTMLTVAIGTVTAATVGGIIAFFVFFIRFYIENAPK